MTLLDIYHRTLALCAPDVLVQRVASRDMPRNVVAIGKCAGPLLDGFAKIVDVANAIVVMPDGYRRPSADAEVVIGGHPYMTPSSFAAGKRVIEFVDAHDDVTFLISGGGSACVEVALPPFSEREVIDNNARLVDSALPIAEINAQRKRMSAIKDGRLGARVRGRCITLIYSDVGDDRLSDVASAPSLRDMRLVASNRTLVDTASTLMHASPLDHQIEGDVDDAARQLLNELQRNEVVVAGGEPTVEKRGDGKGGRCMELAVRFALQCGQSGVHALFASSDGVDGNSGAAGVYLRGIAPFDRDAAKQALQNSASAEVAAQIGELIIIPPTGNNLRDLFLLARS